jgi:hypothetical protein
VNILLFNQDRYKSSFSICASNNDSCLLLSSIKLCRPIYHKTDIVRTHDWGLNFDSLARQNYNVQIIRFKWKRATDAFI